MSQLDFTINGSEGKVVSYTVTDMSDTPIDGGSVELDNSGVGCIALPDSVQVGDSVKLKYNQPMIVSNEQILTASNTPVILPGSTMNIPFGSVEPTQDGVHFNDIGGYLSTYTTDIQPLVYADGSSSSVSFVRNASYQFGSSWTTLTQAELEGGDNDLPNPMVRRSARLIDNENGGPLFIEFSLTGLTSGQTYMLRAAGYTSFGTDLCQLIRVNESAITSTPGSLAGPGDTISAGAYMGTVFGGAEVAVVTPWVYSEIEGGVRTGGLVTFTPVGSSVNVRIEQTFYNQYNIPLVVSGVQLIEI